MGCPKATLVVFEVGELLRYIWFFLKDGEETMNFKEKKEFPEIFLTTKDMTTLSSFLAVFSQQFQPTWT